jgi:hypothetical protein
MANRLTHISSSFILALLILFGLAIRLGSMDTQSLWRDEVDSIRFGDELASEFNRALSGGGFSSLLDTLRTSLTQPGFNGPLYFIALDAWAGATGASAFALRFLSTLFGILVIPLIYVLSQRLFASTRVSLLSAALATLSPYFVWYAQEVKMYTAITALALLAIYAMRRAIDAPAAARTWPWWLTMVLAISLAMYCHILAALLIGVAIALLVLWRRKTRAHWAGALIAIGALTLPYLPLAIWQLPLAFTPGSQGHPFYRFDEMLRILSSNFASGVLSFDYMLATLGLQWSPEVSNALSAGLLGALVIIGVLFWKGANERIERLALAGWMLLPVVLVALISLNRPIFNDRYMIWIGPAVYILTALGLNDILGWKKVVGVSALVLAAAAALLGVHGQATTIIKPDFRAAAQYVAQRYRGDEVLLFQIPYAQYTFDYYFEPPFQIGEGPYTNHRNGDGGYLRDAASFDAEIASALQGRGDVWYIATEVEMWDERHVLENWLNAHGRITDRADYVYVSVVHYELNH